MTRIYLNEETINDFMRLDETANPYYKTGKEGKYGLKELWTAIKAKQKKLEEMLYGEIDDLTREKAKMAGVKKLDIPKVIAVAGNAKVPSNVLMVNITSSLACPSFYLGLCEIAGGVCYAQRAENQYNNARNRNMQTDLMNTELLRRYQKNDKTPMKEYFSLIEMYIQIGKAAAKNYYINAVKKLESSGKQLTPEIEAKIREKAEQFKIVDIRLNESGDFPCQLSVNLWTKFAKKVGKKYGIRVHAYTARNLDFSNRPSNFSVLPSHQGINIGSEPQRRFWAVTDNVYDKVPGDSEVTEDYQPILHENPNQRLGYKYCFKCPCGEGQPHCDQCRVCFNQNKTGEPYLIYVRLHGQKNAKGLKHLFTPEEIANVMKLSQKSGWYSNEEMPNAQGKEYVYEPNKKLTSVFDRVKELRKTPEEKKAEREQKKLLKQKEKEQQKLLKQKEKEMQKLLKQKKQPALATVSESLFHKVVKETLKERPQK